MPVTPKLWTVGGLSTELGLNPATVGKIVARLKPDGHVRRRPAYLMANVTRAQPERQRDIDRRSGRSPLGSAEPLPELPPRFKADADPVETLAALTTAQVIDQVATNETSTTCDQNMFTS